jgi:hypothetical protein
LLFDGQKQKQIRFTNIFEALCQGVPIRPVLGYQMSRRSWIDSAKGSISEQDWPIRFLRHFPGVTTSKSGIECKDNHQGSSARMGTRGNGERVNEMTAAES